MTKDQLNQKLIDEYGYYKASESPNWRLVWSEDEMEQRFGTFEDRTASGLFIRRVTEVRNVPKYKQWIRNKYILERIMPNMGNKEILTKLTYEPVQAFENPENAPPSWDAIKFTVELVFKRAKAAMGYAHKEPSFEEQQHLDKVRIDKIKNEIYGDTSDVADALAYREGIVVPRNYGAK